MSCFREQRSLRLCLCGVISFLVLLSTRIAPAQSAPASADRPWHASAELKVGAAARNLADARFAIDAAKTYTLAELIDLAESHNPETRFAWEQARSRGEAVGVARSELFPTLAAAALSKTARQQAYLEDRFFRQTIQTFSLGFDLNYTIFDIGGRSGRIETARADLLGANFAFNDTHRRLIFQVQAAYYQVLNAAGQEASARSNLANAEAVQRNAEARLQNGLATLPDVLEARSAAAQATYDLQAAVGAKEVAQGNLAQALGVSPLSAIAVHPIEDIAIPESIEDSVDQAIDRALKQRPDLMEQIAAIRSANARMKAARAAYFPTLQTRVYVTPESLYGMQQQFPWGHTAGLDGQISFSLKWTLFDGGARKHQVAGAIRDAQAAEAQASAIRDQIENGIWTAYSNLKTAFRQREAAAALLKASDQSYNAALESYRYGVRNLLDVTDAQRTLARARSADVSARTQVLTALASLAFQTGDSIQPKPARPRP